MADLADAEAFGRIHCGSGDHHGGETNQRVKGSHELRHRCHRDTARQYGTYATANCKAENDQQEAAKARLGQEKRGDDGDTHTDHAVGIALPAGCRM